MWLYFVLLLIPSIIVSFIGFYNTKDNRVRNKVTLSELAISIVVCCVISLGSVGGFVLYQKSVVNDYYYITGSVTGKHSENVPCSHSYECNCKTDSKGNRTCSTCYEHTYDVDWFVDSNVGYSKIHRVDDRGVEIPERWSNAVIGERFTTLRQFDNYLLAGDSLLLKTTSKHSGYHPQQIFDYYRYSHVQGGDNEISDAVGELAKKLSINPVVIITKNKQSDIFDAIISDYKSGKLNDVLFVYDVDDDNNLNWMRVASYASNYGNHYMISSVENMAINKKLSVDLVVDQIKEAQKLYKPVSTDTIHEIVNKDIDIPTWLIILALVGNIFASILIHNYMKNEVIA